MVIHSIVTNDILYNGIEELKELEEVRYKGSLVQVQRISTTEAKIVRLINSDPMQFLDPEFIPGQIINLSTLSPRS